MDRYWKLDGGHGLIIRTAFRTSQFLFAIIAAGLYGADLSFFSRAQQDAPSTWIFAEVLVVFTVLVAAAHCFLTIRHLMWSLLDAVLVIMWLAVAALAGQAAFGGRNTELASGITVQDTHIMAAFWVDLINMLLWLATLVEAALLCCTAHTIRRKLENLEMQ
ncbi:hypothetical protein F4825DRAFT_456361 [Nemania diffusa]|nr:hypothetical protein F4825DRAFT_456361 [Nemania diffusa]